MARKVVFITNTALTTYTLPLDWNPHSNTVECIGGGGQGSFIDCGGAGGGGAYSLKNNVPVPPGATIPIQVGAANGDQSGSTANIAAEELANVIATGVTTTGDSFFGGSSLSTAYCSAQGGESGLFHGYQPAPRYGGAGGLASLGVGDTKYSGGAGGNAPSGIGTAGGGGAGGPHGAGATGGNGDPTAGDDSGHGGPNGLGGGGNGGGGGGGGGSNGVDGSTDGGNGGDNYLGSGHGLGAVWNSSLYPPPTGGTAGAGGGGSTSTQVAHDFGGTVAYQGGPGGNGAEWTSTLGATAGSGGGGGGEGSFHQGAAIANGGLYGGGGGAGNSAAGAQGIIVLSYDPATIDGGDYSPILVGWSRGAPQQRRSMVAAIAGTAAVINNPPFSGLRVVPNPAWYPSPGAFEGGSQPYAPRLLNASITAVEVDQPPGPLQILWSWTD